jgi:transcriptional regulator with XRE-family HTH domain
MTTREQSALNAKAVVYLRGIKEARLERITQRDIAAQSGIPYDTVKKIFTNRSQVSVEHFLTIAELLGVDAPAALRALAEIVAQRKV